MARPKKEEIILSELEHRELVELTRSRTVAHGVVRRAQIILASADGESNKSIAGRLGISKQTVGKWRSLFLG